MDVAWCIVMLLFFFSFFLVGGGGGRRRREKAVIVALSMYQACNRNLIGRYEALNRSSCARDEREVEDYSLPHCLCSRRYFRHLGQTRQYLICTPVDKICLTHLTLISLWYCILNYLNRRFYANKTFLIPRIIPINYICVVRVNERFLLKTPIQKLFSICD